jgi:hypothetical protein
MSKPIIPMVSSVAEGRCHALWNCQPLGTIGCRALQSTSDAATERRCHRSELRNERLELRLVGNDGRHEDGAGGVGERGGEGLGHELARWCGGP